MSVSGHDEHGLAMMIGDCADAATDVGAARAEAQDRGGITRL